MIKSFFKDRKKLVILLLSLLCVLRIPSAGNRFLLWVLAGVIISASCDFLIKRLFLKQSQIPKSAIISGFIVAGIIDYGQALSVLAIFSFLAVISKYTFKFRKKHIFNPANFALFFAALCKQPLTWNIETNSYFIIITGIYLAVSLRKWPHVVGFIVVFSGLLYSMGINAVTMISWFFVFIMLIEPKTSGFGFWRGISFGGVAAVVSVGIFKCMPQIDMFVTALMAANIVNMFMEYIKQKGFGAKAVSR